MIAARLRPARASVLLAGFAVVSAFSAARGFDPAPAFASPSSRPLAILWVGNSFTYTNDLPGLVESLAVSAGEPAPVWRLLAGGGWSLEDHWNQGAFRRAVGEFPADVVVLQQGPSASPEGRSVLLRDVRRFAELIRKSGATPALYTVWPARSRHQDFPRVIESYRMAAEEARGILLPVGDSWRIAEKAHRDLPLYSSDDLHPTRQGSYLAAVVIVSRLYSVAPRDLASRVSLRDGSVFEIPADDARRLQDAAAQAVADLPAVRFRGAAPAAAR